MARTPMIPVLLSVITGIAVLVFLLGDRLGGIPEGLRPGVVLPAARLKTVAGRAVDTLEWRGTPTLLVVFQPSCAACNREIGKLAGLASDYPEVNMVLVSLETPSPDYGVPFTVCTDPSGEFIYRIRKVMVPTLYGIDREGRIAFTRMGKRPAEEEKALLAALAGKFR